MKRLAVWIGVIALLGSMAVPVVAQQTPAPGTPAAPAAKAPTPAKRLTAFGHVKSSAADSLVVRVGKAQKEETFVVDPTTKITKAGKAIPATDLTVNDSVRVHYTEAEGKLVAQTVTVRTGKVAAKATTGSAPQGSPKTP